MASIEIHSVVRSKRKTIAILVQDGKIFVKAPLSVKNDAIQQFVQKNTAWIQKKLSLQAARQAQFQSILQYEEFLYEGKRKKPVFSSVKKISFSDDAVLIPQIYTCDRIENNEKLRRALLRKYKELAEQRLFSLLTEYSRLFGLPFASFHLTNAASKWGSCDSKNNIRLNWRLIALEPELASYVVIHELCHTKFHNHARQFWKAVENCDKNYKQHRNMLKEYALIIQKLFR